MEDLFYQYVKKLEQDKEVDHGAVFIDGTKLESRAGRYTFCWRGSVEKNLEKVKIAILEQTGLTNIYVDEMGTLISPHYLTSAFPKLLKKNDLRHILFHDL